MILKKKYYPLKNGYIIHTITGKDKKGIYFFIGVFDAENAEHKPIEKYYYRNTVLANQKFEECKVKYRNKIKAVTSLAAASSAGYNLSQQEKLDPGNGGAAGYAANEIRSHERGISEKPPAGSLCGSGTPERIKRPSDGDTKESGNALGVSDQPPEESGRRDRTAKSDRSAQMGGNDEQYQSLSRGNCDGGTHLQLNTQTVKGDSVVKETLPPFLYEDAISALLCRDDYMKAKRSDVIRYFKYHKDRAKRTAYLKDVYNDEYSELIILDNQRFGYKKDDDGLLMWEGSFLTRTAEAHFSWDILQALISDMIKQKIYLPSPAAKEKKAEWELTQQLSLFDTGVSEVSIAGSSDYDLNLQTEKSSFSLQSFSAAMIENILRTGGNEMNSRIRIYAKYRQGKDASYMVSFLQYEYGRTGKGFIFNGMKVSVWFDNDGMRIGYGDSACHSQAIIYTWEKVENIIRSMVENGTYMSAEEVKSIDEIEHKRTADRVLTFFRDMVNEFPSVLGNPLSNGWPDGIDKISNMLSTAETCELLLRLIDSDIKRLDSGEIKPRLRLIYSAHDVRNDVADLLLEKKSFPVQDNIEIKEVDFITQDEIDTVLCGGNSFTGGKLSIYQYFRNGFSQDENIKFLKKSYGIGGRSNALPSCNKSWENHDSKGIYLSKGDLTNPTVEILLNWKTVEERIRKLIQLKVYAADLSVYDKVYDNDEYDDDAEELDDDTSGNLLTSSDTEETEDVWDLSQVANMVPSDTGKVTKSALPEKPKDLKNFRLKEKGHELSHTPFSPKEKFRQNLRAIQTLKRIEEENRYATADEQQILSQYVGWGGLSEAFDETKSAWTNEYQELKALLSDSEYVSARESVLNSHYTGADIINYIYKVLEQLGFEKGNILEPALGVGNFFSLLPENMQDSKLYGVELDSISGRIAKQLYPNANIQVCGFEKTNFQNNFFDVAIGNVPFGQYGVNDPEYNNLHFPIHDFFFAKTIDKVRPGGVIIFITSKNTMDRKNSAARKYIAARAELLAAVRLPDTAFKATANTEAVADILILQKRDRIITETPDWVELSNTPEGIDVNKYFAAFPQMMLGKMEIVSGPFGSLATCAADSNISLSSALSSTLPYIRGKIEAAEPTEEDMGQSEDNIPADINVKNYSFTLADDKVYYRENSIMRLVSVPKTTEIRIRRLLRLRDCTYDLIQCQLNGCSDSEIKNKQAELNRVYDSFFKDFGSISSLGNKKAFEQDSSYYLLCSLEVLDEEGKYIGKADIFHKRTINKPIEVTHADTAIDALIASMNEKAKVDFDYMQQLTGKVKETLIEELTDSIFQNPITGEWEPADEYLSGNVVQKLDVARAYAKDEPKYSSNVKALERVQPKPLTASEIEVRLGAAWIEPKYIEDFMRDIFRTSPAFLGDEIKVTYSTHTGVWNISGKKYDFGNPTTNKTYGTDRLNAYYILEKTLNQSDVRIFDRITDSNGNDKRVLNKDETSLAIHKQEAIKDAFKDWIFSDPKRRQELCEKYNATYNTIRPREYDGSHLQFHGISPEITLRPHQKNAIAHILYGNNTLLAHVVGAGKTYTMTAAAMELKHLGLCNKSMFVVPNHLIGQWASEFLRLYPGARILATTEKDFETKNRKRFCSRISTGDYDAVIIGHSQFEKIPLSKERQAAIIKQQISDIEMSIDIYSRENGMYFTVKQLEKTRKSLLVKLQRLMDSKQDDVVTFEQLGVDRLFVDESHNYKNLFLYTKMRNVAGVPTSDAKKSSDMFAKCQYISEITGNKGITFATGTPISNSMTELYTNMRYLQYDTLIEMGLGHFDSWAATFGETKSVVELAPEGTGYITRTRFARFYNLPELISLFKEVADIQTADMLNLPRPEAEYINVQLKPSEIQRTLVSELAERAEAIRKGNVDPSEDNMLRITNDGRNLALDQRLISDLYPDDNNSKINALTEKVIPIWRESKQQKGAQLIFCDLSTPKKDGSFNVYDDIRTKLIAAGVPADEIAYIHDANTIARKTKLFAKVRKGRIRFLLGSTAKMGAGTNVQDRLIALHHLDVPWRPSDLEQREGRILREGNMYGKVKIFRYVTENTFDGYSWQVLENKQGFISQIMTSKSPVRSAEDIDELTLTYGEIKALGTGNPLIKEKMELDVQVSRLKLYQSSFNSQKYKLEDDINSTYPRNIKYLKTRIKHYEEDIQTYEENRKIHADFSIQLQGKIYDNRKEAGSAIVQIFKGLPNRTEGTEDTVIGQYLGFQLILRRERFSTCFVLTGALSYEIEFTQTIQGTLLRLQHTLEELHNKLEETKETLDYQKTQFENAKIEVQKTFPKEAELKEKQARLNELNALLNVSNTNEAAKLAG